MPILDVMVVGAFRGDAQRLADAAAKVLGTERARTWVRLRRIDENDYAENGGMFEGARPVFAHVLMQAPPENGADLARRLGAAFADVLVRPRESVHIVFEPAAAGRIAFGGTLVPAAQRECVASDARWEAIVGYSRAVRVGSHIWVTGTTAFTEGGEPTSGDAYAQAVQALGNIERALNQLGAELRHVVRTRMFVVDIARDWELVGRAHAERFSEIRPATTMVEVRRLIEEWMLVEIEADAYLG